MRIFALLNDFFFIFSSPYLSKAYVNDATTTSYEPVTTTIFAVRRHTCLETYSSIISWHLRELLRFIKMPTALLFVSPSNLRLCSSALLKCIKRARMLQLFQFSMIYRNHFDFKLKIYCLIIQMLLKSLKIIIIATSIDEFHFTVNSYPEANKLNIHANR